MNTYATSWREAVHAPSHPVDRVRALARRATISALGALQRGIADQFVRCLYCHYVFDDQVADFERIILQLKAMGSFVDTDRLLRLVTGVEKVDKRYFHLSFDDGFRNNLTNALPILKKHDVPAIFFVPSAMVSVGWDQTRDYCLNITKYRSVVETLGWDDLKALLEAGYEVGSHTRTHARFATISSDQRRMEDEIFGSKQELESRLGYRCRYISWPYGKTIDADEWSVNFTKNAGYEACFGAFRGTVVPQQTDRYRIPRHHFEPQWPLSHVAYFARGNMEAAG